MIEKEKLTGVGQILDSGDRTEYQTGAVRDCKEGKGRCDLMPLDMVAYVEEDSVLDAIFWFQQQHNISHLKSAIRDFCKGFGLDMYNMALELSKHFEAGAKKYGENNWQKGIPVHSYIDSAIRHYLKFRAGWEDEPHGIAFIWNLMCCMWTMAHKPDLDDFTVKEEEKHETPYE